MAAPVTAVISVSARAPGPPRTGPPDGLTFHAVLSALNPLQYLPVVGTIYRAVTGDIIPELERRIGSLIASGLLGGPIGVAINIVTTALEKITGIDLDRTGQALLHGEPLDQAIARPPDAKQGGEATARTAVPPKHSGGTAKPNGQEQAETANPWSAAVLAAYGAQSDHAGTLRMAGLQGADVLNALELSRLHTARSAYARTAALGG